LARGQQIAIIASAVAPARVLALTAAGQLFDYPPTPGRERPYPTAINLLLLVARGTNDDYR
jgi:hypothetical protein